MKDKFVKIIRESSTVLEGVRQEQSPKVLELFLDLSVVPALRNLHRALDLEPNDQDSVRETLVDGYMLSQGASEKLAAMDYFSSLDDEELGELYQSVAISLSMNHAEVKSQQARGFTEPLLYLVHPELTLIEAQELMLKGLSSLDSAKVCCANLVFDSFADLVRDGLGSVGISKDESEELQELDSALVALSNEIERNAEKITTSRTLIRLVNDYTGYAVPKRFMDGSEPTIADAAAIVESVASTDVVRDGFVKRCENALQGANSVDEFGQLSDKIVATAALPNVVAVALRAYQLEMLMATARFSYAQRILKYLQALVVKCGIQGEFLLPIWRVIFEAFLAFVTSGRKLNLNKALIQYLLRFLPESAQSQFRSDLAEANPVFWKD